MTDRLLVRCAGTTDAGRPCGRVWFSVDRPDWLAPGRSLSVRCHRCGRETTFRGSPAGTVRAECTILRSVV